MKFNRIMSAAIAACMSLTMFAGAANLDAAANSTEDSEPKTLTGVAHVLSADGSSIEKPFEYTIPVNASEAEEDHIALQAAREAAGITSKARANYVRLGSESDVTIPRKSSSLGHEIPITRDIQYDGGSLEFALRGVTGCSSVNLSFEKFDRFGNGTNFWQGSIDVDDDLINVFFYDGGMYPNTTLYLYEGDMISAYISGNVKGWADKITVYNNNY
ncbi:MAG: hypothetical protein HFH26_11775 [Clostridiaceae bacterium]|nr:hypothetical protein [Clostridiaceae bacterium]